MADVSFNVVADNRGRSRGLAARKRRRSLVSDDPAAVLNISVAAENGSADDLRPYADAAPHLRALVQTEIRGDGADNTLVGSDGDELFLAFGGNDRIFYGGGIDTVMGGSGNDVVRPFEDEGRQSTSYNVIYGEEGDDDITGSNGNNWLSGGAGNDTIRGAGGNDTISAGEGDDRIDGGEGADLIVGHDGTDTVTYENSKRGVSVNLSTGKASGGDAQGDSLYGVENLEGSSYNDVLTGDGGSNSLSGGSGRDKLNGRGGDDLLVGGTGADTLDGGDGSDTASYDTSEAGVIVQLFSLGGPGKGSGGDAEGDTLVNIENLTGSRFDDFLYGDYRNNVLAGGSGNDMLRGGFGADALNGGEGNDTAAYFTSGSGVKVDLRDGVGRGGDAEGDSLVDIENVHGSVYDDVLIGDAKDNYLTGYLGNDTLEGGAGNDTYFWRPGDGSDAIEEAVGGGNDTLLFGDGVKGSNVSAARSGGDFVLTIAGETSASLILRNQIWGVIDQVKFASGETWSAADLLEKVYDQVESGGNGKDTLTGTTGDDFLAGGKGNDTYRWNRGSGNDFIQEAIRGGGNDTLFLGKGITASDVSVGFSGSDIILTIGGPRGGSVRLGQQLHGAIERIRFSDGKEWSADQLNALAFDAALPEGTLLGDALRENAQNAMASGSSANWLPNWAHKVADFISKSGSGGLDALKLFWKKTETLVENEIDAAGRLGKGIFETLKAGGEAVLGAFELGLGKLLGLQGLSSHASEMLSKARSDLKTGLTDEVTAVIMAAMNQNAEQAAVTLNRISLLSTYLDMIRTGDTSRLETDPILKSFEDAGAEYAAAVESMDSLIEEPISEEKITYKQFVNKMSRFDLGFEITGWANEGPAISWGQLRFNHMSKMVNGQLVNGLAIRFLDLDGVYPSALSGKLAGDYGAFGVRELRRWDNPDGTKTWEWHSAIGLGAELEGNPLALKPIVGQLSILEREIEAVTGIELPSMEASAEAVGQEVIETVEEVGVALSPFGINLTLQGGVGGFLYTYKQLNDTGAKPYLTILLGDLLAGGLAAGLTAALVPGPVIAKAMAAELAFDCVSFGMDALTTPLYKQHEIGVVGAGWLDVQVKGLWTANTWGFGGGGRAQANWLLSNAFTS
ncbi:hypothetical protein [Aestuariivirga sp.]|uniref:hypothetical protein n=1 Tax=Aestuariivirga sp. TaxID=2650926 RepID=UPI003918B1A4